MFISRKYENLFPHERDIVNNEYFQMRKVQDKLNTIIRATRAEKIERAFEELGGEEGILRIVDEMGKKGMTVERIQEMNNEELTGWLKENNIKV